MSLRFRISTLSLIVAMVALCLSLTLITIRHNAQLMAQAERFNAQLFEEVARHNAQLMEQTASCNEQLLSQAAEFQRQRNNVPSGGSVKASGIAPER
jgi:C4-dicarboxylate-specific signal transduction histidine kinase